MGGSKGAGQARLGHGRRPRAQEGGTQSWTLEGTKSWTLVYRGMRAGGGGGKGVGQAGLRSEALR